MRKISVKEEPIELYKLLKLAALVTSGSEAKSLIAEGRVSVNSEPESRKRRKITSEDVVSFEGEELMIAVDSDAEL